MERPDERRIEDILEESPKKHMELGVTYYINGDIDRAISELKLALKLKPDYIVAFFNLAAMLKEKGKLKELEELKGEIQKALEMSVKRAAEEKFTDPKVHLELGVLFYINGNYEEAEREFRQAIKLNPDYSLAYYNLAVLLQETGRKEEAETEFKKAREKRETTGADE